MHIYIMPIDLLVYLEVTRCDEKLEYPKMQQTHLAICVHLLESGKGKGDGIRGCSSNETRPELAAHTMIVIT